MSHVCDSIDITTEVRNINVAHVRYNITSTWIAGSRCLSLDLILCLIPTYLQAIAQGLRSPYVVFVNVLPAPPDSPATLQLVAAATLRDATALPATVVAPGTAVFGSVRPISSP